MQNQVAGMKYDNNAPNSRRPFCEATSLSSELPGMAIVIYNKLALIIFRGVRHKLSINIEKLIHGAAGLADARAPPRRVDGEANVHVCCACGRPQLQLRGRLARGRRPFALRGASQRPFQAWEWVLRARGAALSGAAQCRLPTQRPRAAAARTLDAVLGSHRGTVSVNGDGLQSRDSALYW